MRYHKDNVFYYESGEKANPLEKNTIHAFVKTLSDSSDQLTRAFLELCGVGQPELATTFDFRTEVSQDDAPRADGEQRVLVGISRSGGVKEGGGTGETSHVDARIRAHDSQGNLFATVFVEAKAGGADLTEGQLSDYAGDFAITEREAEVPWSTLQWADIYRIFEDAQAGEADSQARVIEKYLTAEFNQWLRQKGMVRGIIGVSESGGEDGRKYRKRLLISPPEPGAAPVITFWAFSRRETRNQSSSMEVPQETFEKLFGELDGEMRRRIFMEGDLDALREWVKETRSATDSQLESGYAFAQAEREGYDDPAGVKLSFKRTREFRINQYNVNSDKGWVRYPPILVDEEWQRVFTQVAEELTEEQEEQFVESFDFDILWDAYLNRSGQ